ncbi:helix-turn-helix domain-containing protein [Amycolatopsis rhabdoformis]|uniref:Helix-turn-helix domain-containing protein n=1 Tax=Amycolatopsis rhabdoformis TaxID=1448059 RepID=A0ABZ1HWN0_9PSEU|nr:helix-turn-helix domain-containing protein [Amycolatopsis rhabdoformis]WSE26607.1 helix-turn-helix domain-containing protein [Amycolatopsis rhabdoformis]
MKRTSFAQWPCSIARTMDLLGDWWTPLVLRDAFYGVTRFDEFQQALGIARNTLADRLRRLVDEGLLEKVAYQTEPMRYDYLLTDKGKDFFGVLAAMTAWGDRWLSGEAGPPITTHHEKCGHDTQAEVVCAHCGEPLTAEDTRMRRGPGFPSKIAHRPDVEERFAKQEAAR